MSGSVKPSDIKARQGLAKKAIQDKLDGLKEQRAQYIQRQRELQQIKEEIEAKKLEQIKKIEEDHAQRKKAERKRVYSIIVHDNFTPLSKWKVQLRERFGTLLGNEREQDKLEELILRVKPERDAKVRELKEAIEELVRRAVETDEFHDVGTEDQRKEYAKIVFSIYTDKSNTRKPISNEALQYKGIKEIIDIIQKISDKYHLVDDEYRGLLKQVDPSYKKPLKDVWSEIEAYQKAYDEAKVKINEDYNKWTDTDYKEWKKQDQILTATQVHEEEQRAQKYIDEVESEERAIEEQEETINLDILQTQDAARGVISRAELTGKGTVMKHLKLVSIHHSTAKGKKFVVVLQEGGTKHTIQFGAKGYQDFTQHHDEARKKQYLSRHKKREDWTDPLTAGFWSRWVLWNLPSLKGSIEDTKKRFNL